MFVARVAEVMHIELIIPIGHHGLMVICPPLSVSLCRVFAIGPHNLDVMHTDHWRQASVVTIGITQRLTRIVNLLGIQQTLQDGFVSLKDGAVLMQVGDNGLVADILEDHKIFRKVRSEVLQTIAVVVDEPAILYGFVHFTRYLYRCRAFHHLTRKRF